MNFCRVYLRSRLPCILGPRFWITNSCSGRARVLKCFLLASSPLSENTFSKSSYEGNGRDFLTHSSQSLCEQRRGGCSCARAERWQMGWLVDFLHWQTAPRQGLGEITDCRGSTNPLLTCRHLRAERPHYHPTANCCPCDTLRRVVRPAGTVGKSVSESAKNVSESEKIVSESEKLCFAHCLRRRHLFSSERRVRHVATAVG